MKKIDIAKAWKDPVYRSTLNAHELAALPESPAGLMEVTDADLLVVSGGNMNEAVTSLPCGVTILSVITIALCITITLTIQTRTRTC